MELKVISENEEMTMQIAEKYAKGVKSPCVITLQGDLGAGKTTFSKGFAKGFGVEDVVTSPTFTIMNEYQGTNMPLYHFDMYRLGSKEEAINCGFEDYFDLTKLKGVALVEWPENVQDLIPALHVEVNIKKVTDQKREISMSIKGWV